MPVSDDRKYTKDYIYNLLQGVKGKTLGEVDKSNQFARTQKSEKITGIAGDVIEQSVFGYDRDSKQECDIEIDGILTELKTTGVRIPKTEEKRARGKTGNDYNILLAAKEGISITGVTLEPTIQTDFYTSHFWEKSEHLLIVFYEYRSYEVVPASHYADFPIVDYCYNTFSEEEREKLRNDWEIVRNYLQPIYEKYTDPDERRSKMEGFTHKVRQNLLLIELVPGYKKRVNKDNSISYQHPRYRLKQTFVNTIVKGHFNQSRTNLEIKLKESFSSFTELDKRCHLLTEKYKNHTLTQLKDELSLDLQITQKDFTAACIVKMFDATCNRLSQISDFNKTGIIPKTITITPSGSRTEDMKLSHIDFEEWADRDVDFSDSEIYSYFCEHSFLCSIFCEYDSQDASKTIFLGFKRFAFDEDFIEQEVKRTWEDSRHLIHTNQLKWEYTYDKKGNKRVNKSGSFMGAPNFPKSKDYEVFLRGGNNDSSEKAKTECVNGIYMLPQFFWLKGSFIANKLKTKDYI